MNDWIRIAAWAALFGLTGCAVSPLGDAARSAAERVDERTGIAPSWPPGEAGPAGAAQAAGPLTLPQAHALAFSRNPEILRQYARLGIAQADLLQAARIANPSVTLAWLEPDGSGDERTTRGVSASFADLLLLPARRRLAGAELRRMELSVGAALVSLAHRVDAAWYVHVAAQQVASLRSAVAEASQYEAELAARFHAAGNISRLQLDRQQAAAARSQVEALRAQAEATDARVRLAGLLGLEAAADWLTAERLAQPPAHDLPADRLAGRAAAQRLDLAAARERVSVLEDARGVASRWRWLGAVEVGYERERESGGTKLRGPTLALELPLFDQGQGRVAGADAELMEARADVAALELAVANDVSAAAAKLAFARQAVERYRGQWLPAAGSAVERQQERFNFMLVGASELIQSKREQFDAWQGYLESVRDYWLARTDLRAATGGRLPGDGDALPPTEAPEEIIRPAAGENAARDAAHDHHGEHGP